LPASLSFVNIFRDDNIAEVIAGLRSVRPSTVVEQIRATNGADCCREAWRRVLAVEDAAPTFAGNAIRGPFSDAKSPTPDERSP
jgi:hypothetical protein